MVRIICDDCGVVRHGHPRTDCPVCGHTDGEDVQVDGDGDGELDDEPEGLPAEEIGRKIETAAQGSSEPDGEE